MGFPKTIGLSIPVTASSRSWVKEKNELERGAQIASECNPEAGISLASTGDMRSEQGEVLEVDMTFLYRNLDLAAAEFHIIGKRLQFPPGAELTHRWINPDYTTEIVVLATW